jgi:hypothetical protein
VAGRYLVFVFLDEFPEGVEGVVNMQRLGGRA